MIKTYSELIRLPTFEERLDYLRLRGRVGEDTFGFDRFLNQKFYHSSGEWKQIRRRIILRDNGCDLAAPDREILGEPVYIHHINPLSLRDLEDGSELLLDPENLICTTFNTHQAIHYERKLVLPKLVTERAPNDTSPWKKPIESEVRHA